MSSGTFPSENPPATPLLLPPVNADRRLRGPYTAASAIVSALVPAARPELVARYDIELRAVAPDARELIPLRRQSLAPLLPKAERILVHAPRRTLRLSNGIAEFIRDHLAEIGPRTLVVENVHEADPTDRELLTVLRRRISPELLTVVTGERPVPAEHLRPEEHDALAEALEREGTVGARLGAVPYHRERGTDPRAAVEAFAFAVEWCLDAGCHDAVAELGRRALRLADPESTDPKVRWRLLHSTATALGALSREEEAEALFDLARRESVSPLTHAAAAYSTAMLKVRHHDPARRDFEAGLAWVNQAIAISTLLPDPRERAFKLGFDLNGRALVEVRLGHPAKALELVQEALELAERELPGEHPIHRMVLLANRAQLAVMLGRPEEALEDLNAVIEIDPGYPDYYIDRGNLLHRLGRPRDAIADYETAMRAGPPFPEPYYNRAEVRFSAGDHAGALGDLDRALELDPEFVDALANRAGLLAAFGEYGRARADAETGLAIDPLNPYLLCALGQIEMAEGHPKRARTAFDQALELSPSLTAAWANRGILAFETGDPEGAVADFSRALEPGADPVLLFNRAMALRAAGREEEALADLDRARKLAPDDDDIRKALARP